MSDTYKKYRNNLSADKKKTRKEKQIILNKKYYYEEKNNKSEKYKQLLEHGKVRARKSLAKKYLNDLLMDFISLEKKLNE